MPEIKFLYKNVKQDSEKKRLFPLYDPIEFFENSMTLMERITENVERKIQKWKT